MIDHTAASVYARAIAKQGGFDAIERDEVLAEWYEALVDWCEEHSHATRVEMIRRDWPEFTY